MKRQSCTYKVDLSAYLLSCERNYFQLKQLSGHEFIAKESGSKKFQLNHTNAMVYLAWRSIGKFTSEVQVISRSPIDWCRVDIDIRAYHDVNTLDIMRFQGHSGLWPKYPYPNKKMYQQDEKLRQQQFLTRFFTHCIEHGLSVETIFNFKK